MQSSTTKGRVEEGHPLTAESAGTADVRFSGVGLRYGRGPEVLSDVDMALEPGTFTFLTGPSGAGKSSLINLIYLNRTPSRGLIQLFGQDTATQSDTQRQNLKRRIGVVLQDFRLVDHLNVFENVALPLRVTGQSRDSYSQDVRELLGWVGLGHRIMAMPPTLSGGEKQRAAIARAIIAKPDILIADEPTGNVDPEMSKRLLRLFVEMNRQGTTVLIATHDLELLDEVESGVLTLTDGRLTRTRGT